MYWVQRFLFVALGASVAAAALYGWWWVQVDRCLDRGGRWDEATGTCVYWVMKRFVPDAGVNLPAPPP